MEAGREKDVGVLSAAHLLPERLRQIFGQNLHLFRCCGFSRNEKTKQKNRERKRKKERDMQAEIESERAKEREKE